jgi:hypothetical protein
MKRLGLSILIALSVLILSSQGTNAQGESVNVKVDLPSLGSKVSQLFLLKGTATPGSQIEVTGTLSATTTADSKGNWQVPLPNQLKEGAPIELTVQASYGMGKSSKAVVNYTASGTMPPKKS